MSDTLIRSSLQALHGTLWLAEERRLRQTIAQVLSFRECPTPRQLAKERSRRLETAKQTAARAVRAQKGKVAVIPIHGPIEQRLSSAGMKAGGCSTEEISHALDCCLNDAGVSTIVFHVDSPGGSSYGVEELADKIYQARGAKNLYAIADSMACSAAYWLATSAEHFCCTPGGDCGSVGAYMMHVDQSAALEQAGQAVTLIAAGKYKTEGHPFGPLDQEALDHFQSQVAWCCDKFHEALARNRNVKVSEVRANYGQGRVFNADQALKAGMVDKLSSFEDLMAKLCGRDGGSQARAASVAILKMRQAQREREAQLPGLIQRLDDGPRPDEDYDEWMDRCQESGKDEEACDVLWRDSPNSKAKASTFTRKAAPGLTHDSKITLHEPKWSSVDKEKLPNKAFADMTQRTFPHHWVQGGGKPDQEGRYTIGDLWLHRGGLDAAWAAANGARSGEKASAEVIAHLQKHREALADDHGPDRQG